MSGRDVVGSTIAEVLVVDMRTTSLWVGGAGLPPPVKLKSRPLRSSTPSRASAAAAVVISATSTADSFSRSAGSPVTVRSAYIG